MSFKPWSKSWWIEREVGSFVKENKEVPGMDWFLAHRSKIGLFITAVGGGLATTNDPSFEKLGALLAFIGGVITRLPGVDPPHVPDQTPKV